MISVIFSAYLLIFAIAACVGDAKVSPFDFIQCVIKFLNSQKFFN
jgi:hypothetical protein